MIFVSRSKMARRPEGFSASSLQKPAIVGNGRTANGRCALGRDFMFRLMMRIGLALSLAWSGYEVLPRAMDAVAIFGFRNDPVQMLLYRLSGLDKPAYEKEIAAALAKDDPELARSLAELAESRGIASTGRYCSASPRWRHSA